MVKVKGNSKLKYCEGPPRRSDLANYSLSSLLLYNAIRIKTFRATGSWNRISGKIEPRANEKKSVRQYVCGGAVILLVLIHGNIKEIYQSCRDTIGIDWEKIK